MSATFPPSLALVAHQGGWDEILLVAGPIVVIIAVLAVAKRRVDASFQQGSGGPDVTSDRDPGEG